MTQSPADAVQKAVYAALQGSTGLAAAFLALGKPRVAGLLPVFNHVPRNGGAPTQPYPFVEISNAQDVPASPTNPCDAECEHFLDVECWDDAQTRGSTGAKRLAAAVVVAAARDTLPVAGWSLTVAGADTIRHLPIADGVARSVVTLRYLLDPAA